MSYSLSRLGTVRTGIDSSTPCVLLHSSLLAKIASYDRATAVGSLFSFYKPNYSVSVDSLTLVTSTLASAPPGANVLVNLDSGTWHVWTVQSDGSSALAGGSAVPGTAAAAQILTTNGQVAPPIGSAMALLGTANDGSTWFTGRGTSAAVFTVLCAAISTVAALPGAIAVVQAGSGWVVAQL